MRANGLKLAPRLSLCGSNPLNLCENAIAALYAGVVNQLHPTAGIFSAQPLLFSGDALSYVSLRRAQLDNNQTARTKICLLRGELALPIPGWPASAA